MTSSGAMTNKDDGITPRDNDVLCGKDKRTFNHPGNKTFRDVVQLYLDNYKNAERRSDKAEIADSIGSSVFSNGGKFLRPDESGSFQELNRKEVREKITHALRDALRKQQESIRRRRSNKRKNQEAKKQEFEKRLNNLQNEGPQVIPPGPSAGTSPRHNIPPVPPRGGELQQALMEAERARNKAVAAIQAEARKNARNLVALEAGWASRNAAMEQIEAEAVMGRRRAAQQSLAMGMSHHGMIPPSHMTPPGFGAAAQAAAERRSSIISAGEEHVPNKKAIVLTEGTEEEDYNSFRNKHKLNMANKLPSPQQMMAAATATPETPPKGLKQLPLGGSVPTDLLPRHPMAGGMSETMDPATMAALGSDMMAHTIPALQEQVRALQMMRLYRDQEMAALRVSLYEATSTVTAKDKVIANLQEELSMKNRALRSEKNSNRSGRSDPPPDP